MNKRTNTYLSRGLAALISIFAMASSLSAQAAKERIPRFAIGIEAGTVGYGPVATYTFSKRLTATVGYTMLDYNDTYEDSDASYDGTLEMSNFQAALSWHPFSGTFFLTAGAFVGDSKFDGKGVPNANSTFNIDGVIYTAAQVGTITAQAPVIDGTVPFVGLGWTKVATKTGVGFFFKAGVLFIDAPVVVISSRGGTLSNDPTFQKRLANEAAVVNEDLKDFTLYPVLQIGLIYRF